MASFLFLAHSQLPARATVMLRSAAPAWQHRPIYRVRASIRQHRAVSFMLLRSPFLHAWSVAGAASVSFQFFKPFSRTPQVCFPNSSRAISCPERTRSAV